VTGRRRAAALFAALVLAAVPEAAAGATGHARWRLDARALPLEYLQGLTHGPGGARYFAGVFSGLYRTDRALRERARNAAALPPAVTALGFDHIGDLTFDRSRGGRLILPLECYVPGAPNGGNTCGRGAFGIADPRTLAFRYLVPLDPADIAKAMWAEVGPGGRLVWTSSGRDLLAYRTREVRLGRTAPLRPVRRLRGAVPPSGVTGAAVEGRRLLLAGQLSADWMQVWSVDLGTGARRLELEVTGIAAESEGLDLVGGRLSWMLSPFTPGGRPPTFGPGHSELLTFSRSISRCSRPKAIRVPAAWKPSLSSTRREARLPGSTIAVTASSPRPSNAAATQAPAASVPRPRPHHACASV
jgi:hypothetical protein